MTYHILTYIYNCYLRYTDLMVYALYRQKPYESYNINIGSSLECKHFSQSSSNRNWSERLYVTRCWSVHFNAHLLLAFTWKDCYIITCRNCHLMQQICSCEAAVKLNQNSSWKVMVKQKPTCFDQLLATFIVNQTTFTTISISSCIHAEIYMQCLLLYIEIG